MRKSFRFGILAASIVMAASVCSAIGAFAANTATDVPAGFGDSVAIDVSATNEALNRWQYFIYGTTGEDGTPRGEAVYEDKNVHFRATENGRTGNAMWVDKKTEEGSLTAYPYAVDVTPDQNYKITAYVKSVCDESSENSVSFMIKELDENGAKTATDEFAVLSTVTGATSGWRMVEFIFGTSLSGSKIIPKIEFKGKGDFYLDDMSIMTTTVSSNTVSYRMHAIGKIADGANDELSNNDEPNKTATKGMHTLTAANISSDSSDGDGASLLINDGEVFKTNFASLSPDKTYRFSFKYKHLKVGSKNTLSIRLDYYTTAGEKKYYIDVINGSATEWLTCSVDLKGTEAYNTKGVAITANARYLIDELSIVCLDDGDPMQYVANGSFSGAYTSGYELGQNANVAVQPDGTSVFVAANGVYDDTFGYRGFVRYVPEGLTAGQKYTLSYDYRFAGAAWVNSVLVFHGAKEIKNIINEEVPDGWSNAAYEFTATGNDEFFFYGPSYYFWATYYRNVKVTDAENKQYNKNVNLTLPEAVTGENILTNGTFEGDIGYNSDDWTFKGNAGIYGLVFDTRYEADVAGDVKPDWKICLDGTKENPAFATSKEIAVGKRTLAVALTCYNGDIKDIKISAIAGEKEIFADENGFIELPEGVSSVKLKFSSEKYVAFKKISLLSHTHATPAAEDITTVEATCTTDGGKTYVCADCGKTVYLEKTGKLEHDFEHVHVDATCVNGVDKDVCKRCKGEFNVKVILGDPELHRFEEVILKAPTCTKNGMKQNVCKFCGATSGQAIIPATGEHTYKNGVCTECGAKDPDYGKPSDGSDKGSESSMGGSDNSGNTESNPQSQTGNGCGAGVGGGFAAFGIVAAAAIAVIAKKKED